MFRNHEKKMVKKEKPAENDEFLMETEFKKDGCWKKMESNVDVLQ